MDSSLQGVKPSLKIPRLVGGGLARALHLSWESCPAFHAKFHQWPKSARCCLYRIACVGVATCGSGAACLGAQSSAYAVLLKEPTHFGVEIEYRHTLR